MKLRVQSGDAKSGRMHEAALLQGVKSSLDDNKLYDKDRPHLTNHRGFLE